MGGTGYLATITSAEENQFLVDNFADVIAGHSFGTWLGGYQDLTDSEYAEPYGAWKWITGETWDYTNWHVTSTGGRIEPSNSNQNEHGLQFKWTRTGAPLGAWNDAAQETTFWQSSYRADFTGFVVEYEPVPEPATIAALGLGVAALLRRRRR